MGILQKNTYKKTIEKDTAITIDNVIFKFFNKKKSFYQKSQFLHTLEIIDFAWDNHVIYREKFIFFRFSTHFPNSWRVEISLFSIIFPIVQTQTSPPPVLLGKRQKVPKFYLWVFWQNFEKHDCQSWNVFSQNNIINGEKYKNLPAV